MNKMRYKRFNDFLNEGDETYLELTDGKTTVSLYKETGRWYEDQVLSGKKPYGWGSKKYMGYLKPQDIADYLRSDYGGDWTVELEESVDEARRGTLYKAAKQGSYPATIVVIQDGKVIKQQSAKTPQIVPAIFNTLQAEYPKALIHVEDNTGKRLFSESVNEGVMSELEKLAKKAKNLKDFLQEAGAFIGGKVSGQTAKWLTSIYNNTLKTESVTEGKMTSAKMVKIFKNTTDWGDMGERVYVKKGNLVVIDSWYYGESKARKQLEDSWNPGGSNFEYWKETYGVELKMVDSFSEIRASGRHKKLTTDGIVGVELEISGGSDKPINEALTIDSSEPGAKKVNIMVGRFQPPTLGHLKVLKSLSKQNGHPVVVFLVRAKKVDPKKAPFEIETTQQMFNDLIKKHSFMEDVIVIESAAIDKMYNLLRPMYEPILWGTGSDRMKSYGSQVNKEAYRTELNVDPEFKLHEIKRDEDNISASKVRDAIRDDDMDTFKSMTDRVVHSYYPILKTELTGDK